MLIKEIYFFLINFRNNNNNNNNNQTPINNQIYKNYYNENTNKQTNTTTKKTTNKYSIAIDEINKINSQVIIEEIGEEHIQKKETEIKEIRDKYEYEIRHSCHGDDIEPNVVNVSKITKNLKDNKNGLSENSKIKLKINNINNNNNRKISNQSISSSSSSSLSNGNNNRPISYINDQNNVILINDEDDDY